MSAEPVNKGQTKGRIFFAVKVGVAVALLTWLVRSGSLDFGALAILFARPWLGIADLALVGLAVLVATFRWRALLDLAGVRPPLRRLLHLQSAAVFFNVVIPGNVGGDVIKALYVARDSSSDKRTSILLIVFVERLLGLIGLILFAALIVLARSSVIFADPLLRPLGGTVLLLGAGAVVGPALVILIMRRAGHHLEAWTSGPSRIAKLFAQLVAAMRLLTSRVSGLLVALALSMVGHAAAMAMFTLLTRALGHDVSFSTIATIFPLGLLTLILPVSPAGIGVGHVAFDRLFAAAGLTGGATVFNVYLIGQIAPNLLGVFPYVALRRTGELPTPAEAPAEQ